MPAKTFAEFKAAYDLDGHRTITEIVPARDDDGNSPFIVVHHGPYTAVLALMPFDDHLCIDVFPFADGKDATAGVFGMTEGRRFALPGTGTTSHGWSSANLVTVLVGKQGTGPEPAASAWKR